MFQIDTKDFCRINFEIIPCEPDIFSYLWLNYLIVQGICVPLSGHIHVNYVYLKWESRGKRTFHVSLSCCVPIDKFWF